MSKITTLKKDIRDHAASKRGIFAPDKNSWSWKRFARWADLKGVPRKPKNFCSYWRIVLFHSYKRGAWHRLQELLEAIAWPFAWSWNKLHTRGRKGMAFLVLAFLLAWGAKLAHNAWGEAFWSIAGLVVAGVLLALYTGMGATTAYDEVIRRRRLRGKSIKLRPHILYDEKPAWGWIVATLPIFLLSLLTAGIVFGSLWLLAHIVIGPFLLLHAVVAKPLQQLLRLSTTKPIWISLLIPALATGAVFALDATLFPGIAAGIGTFFSGNWPTLLRVAITGALIFGFAFALIAGISYLHEDYFPARKKEREKEAERLAREEERLAAAGKLSPEAYARRHHQLELRIRYGSMLFSDVEDLKEILKRRLGWGEITQGQHDELLGVIDERRNLGDIFAKNPPRAKKEQGALHNVGEFFSLLYTIIATKKWKICPLVEIPEEEQQKSLSDTAPGGGEWY